MNLIMSVFYNLSAVVVLLFGDMNQERNSVAFWALLILGAIWGIKEGGKNG